MCVIKWHQIIILDSPFPYWFLEHNIIMSILWKIWGHLRPHFTHDKSKTHDHVYHAPILNKMSLKLFDSNELYTIHNASQYF